MEKAVQEAPMFIRQRKLQYSAKPDRPDPIFAKMLQELLGGQWGEISVMMTYLFQGWSCRGPAKYRDMIMDMGTEEIGHVEMFATMIARLLETWPIEAQECRLYHMTEDAGVRDMLSFLIARDTMHQNQWLAAIKELEEDGLEETPVPSNFPQENWNAGMSRISSSRHQKDPRAGRADGHTVLHGRKGAVLAHHTQAFDPR